MASNDIVSLSTATLLEGEEHSSLWVHFANQTINGYRQSADYSMT